MNVPARLPIVSTLSLFLPNIFQVKQLPLSATAKQQQDKGKKHIIVTFAHANGFCKEVWLPVMQMVQDNIAPYLKKNLADKAAFDRVFDITLTTVDLNGAGDTMKRTELINEEHWNAKEAELGWFNMGIDILSSLHQTLSANSPGNSKTKPITIGVGHSMGAASMLHAEYAYPGNFNRLLLFEPVFFEKEFLEFSDEKGYATANPLYDLTLKRKNWFPSKKAAFESYRGRGAFAKWSEESLKAYVHGGFRIDTEKGSGVTLKFKREDEAERYLTTNRIGLKENLEKIKVPIDVAYGQESTHFIDVESTQKHFEGLFDNIVNKGSKSAYAVKGTTHFLPMEDIEAVSSIVMESISKAIANDMIDTQSKL